MTISGRRVRTAAALLGSLLIISAALVLPGSAALAAARPPSCGPKDVTTSYRPLDSAAGHRYGQVVLRNRSGHACRTHGFGGISYVDDLGHQVGAPAVRVSGFEPHLTLRRGQRAVTVLDEALAENYPAETCRPTKVTSLSVIVPNGRVGRFVVHPTTGCADPDVHLMHHTPYRRP